MNLQRSKTSKPYQLSETEQLENYMHTNMASIKKFKERIRLYAIKIAEAESELPRLKRLIERFENGLPEWKEQIEVCRISLTGHNKKLSKQYTKMELLKEKSKLHKQSFELEKKINERTVKND